MGFPRPLPVSLLQQPAHRCTPTAHVQLPTGPLTPTPTSRYADGDGSSLMGAGSRPPACYNFPHSAQLMPDLFQPTSLTASSLVPGQVYNLTVVHEWAVPARLENGSHVVSGQQYQSRTHLSSTHQGSTFPLVVGSEAC